MPELTVHEIPVVFVVSSTSEREAVVRLMARLAETKQFADLPDFDSFHPLLLSHRLYNGNDYDEEDAFRWVLVIEGDIRSLNKGEI